MSILDRIAAGGGAMEGYTSGIQTMQNIQNRALQNQLAQLKIGQTLREIQAEDIHQQNLQKGYRTIQDFMKPLQTQTVTEEAMGPPQAPVGPPTAAGEQPAPEQNPMLVLQQMPTKSIEDLDWQTLGTTLLSNPAPEMQAQGQKFLEFANDLQERISKETEAERKHALDVFSRYGATFRHVAELEDLGNIPGAQKEYAGLINKMQNDPRLTNDPAAQEFIKNYGTYQQGLGKYLFSTTNAGNKVRQQQETERHNIATETAATERNALQKANIQLKRLKENKPETFKSADANTIYRMAVGFHGGLMDEQGNIKLIDPKHFQDIQDLSELASLYFSRKKAKTHNEAISMAASDLKMKKVAAAAEAEKNKPKEEGFWSNLFGGKEEKPAETPIAAPETAPTITPGMERFAKTRNMSVEDLQAAITATAKKHNQTEDEVKKNLGIE